MNSSSSQHATAIKSARTTERKSGRAAFTEDGRSIWEWQTATGVFTRVITEEQLASLEATDLRIEEIPAAKSVTMQSLGARQTVRKTPRRSVPAGAAAQKTSSGVLQGLLRRLIGEN